MTDAITVSCHGDFHIWRLADGIPEFGTLCACGGRIWWDKNHSTPRQLSPGQQRAVDELTAWVEECCQ